MKNSFCCRLNSNNFMTTDSIINYLKSFNFLKLAILFYKPDYTDEYKNELLKGFSNLDNIIAVSLITTDQFFDDGDNVELDIDLNSNNIDKLLHALLELDNNFCRSFKRSKIYNCLSDEDKLYVELSEGKE